MDIEQSHPWLKSGDINPSNAELNPTCHLLALLGAHHILHISRIRVKGVTESTMMAAQNQAIRTNYFKNKLKEETDSKCHLCKQHEETIDHLNSGCQILVKSEYLMRHDKVCVHLHYSICKALGTEMTDKWHTYPCGHGLTHTHTHTNTCACTQVSV